jgi:hypothetical protein
VRLWSLHPSYLDGKGLVALWREALLARAVLMDATRGYKNHPQLIRFRVCADPVRAINGYLWGIYAEAERRQFHFDKKKLAPKQSIKMTVTDRQLKYERKHLEQKLLKRNPQYYQIVRAIKKLRPHPIFRVIPGEIEVWEKVPPEI